MKKQVFYTLPSSSITQRYWLAVIIIATLATGAFLALQSALNDSENTALVVNIAGKQRMLSQKVALEVHNIQHHQNDTNQKLYSKALTQLHKTADDMALANKKLSSGRLTKTDFMAPSSEVLEMYFGEMNLYQRVTDYTNLAKSINETTQKTELLQVINKLNELSDSLLNDLNQVVFQYQIEGESRLIALQKMETFIWLLTLLVLLLEVVFIFRPMAKRVEKGYKIEENFVQQLQDQVELRTIKLEQANRNLAKIASHDPLTGVKNRLTFETDLENLYQEYCLHSQNFAVVIVDLDWFKRVNDKFGHDYGDFVLKVFAKLIKTNIREHDEIYRIGGEEFVLLLNRIELQDLLLKLETLKEMIKTHDYSNENKQHIITASFGVYHSSLFSLGNFKDALKAADSALYEAKSFGRNRVNIANGKELENHQPTKINKITLTFADKGLQQLLRVDGDLKGLLETPVKDLLDEKFALKDLVYQLDYDVLETIQNELHNHQSLSKTIRLKNDNRKVVIARLDVLKQANEVRVIIQIATDLAKRVSDDILIYNFHAMMENTNDFIYFKDRNHVFTAASDSLVSLTSVDSREDLIGKIDYEVFSQELADEYFLLEKEVFNGDVAVSQKFQPYSDINGNEGWVDNRKYPIKNFKGEIVGLFGIARIISVEEYREAITNKLSSEV